MNRLLLLLAVFALAAGVLAQDVKDGLSRSGPSRPPASRMDVIMDSFSARVSLQKDHLFDQGEYPRVIQVLRWECDLDPRNYERWTDLIWMYGNIERREDELATAIEFRSLNLENPEAWYPEAQVHFLRRNWVKVIPLLETSISLGKPHPNSYRLLAQSWNRLGFTEQAVRVWEQMLRVYPADERAKAQLQRAKDQLKQKGSG